MIEAGIKPIEESVAAVELEGERIAALQMGTGQSHPFDSLYSALGSTARTGLLHGLGAALDERHACSLTSTSGARSTGSSRPGMSSAASIRLAIAMGQAAVAATAIHNWLRAASWRGPQASVLR